MSIEISANLAVTVMATVIPTWTVLTATAIWWARKPIRDGIRAKPVLYPYLKTHVSRRYRRRFEAQHPDHWQWLGNRP